jgi:RNA polymerase sigma-70 factor (ECF subfamily)
LNDFSARVQELIPRLRRYARALTGERAAADDLVQDTLERAWNKLHLWRHGSDLRAWLFTIMHNVHVNQIRSRASALTVPLDDDIADAPVRATQSDMLEVRDIDAALQRKCENTWHPNRDGDVPARARTRTVARDAGRRIPRSEP